jgi:hypothetical protein
LVSRPASITLRDIGCFPVLKRILDHLSLPSSPPTVAPARSPLDEAGLFADEPPDDNGDDWTYQEEGSQIARAPP